MSSAQVYVHSVTILTKLACIFFTKISNQPKFLVSSRSGPSRRYVIALTLSVGVPQGFTPLGLAFFSIWLYAAGSYRLSAFSHPTSICSLQAPLNTCFELKFNTYSMLFSYFMVLVICLYLLNKFLRTTLSLWTLLTVSHLNAGKVQDTTVPSHHPCYGSIAITVVQVIISCSELCRMASILVPPMYSRNL